MRGQRTHLPLVLQALIPLHVGKRGGCAGGAKDSKTVLRKQTVGLPLGGSLWGK